MAGCKLGMNYFSDMETFVLSPAPSWDFSDIESYTRHAAGCAFLALWPSEVCSILMVPYVHKTYRNVFYLLEFCVVNQFNQELLNGER